MYRIIIAICLFLSSVNSSYAATFQATYAIHVDIYNFLEHLSQWSDKYILKSYSEYWVQNKLARNEDVSHLKNFKKIKIKHYFLPRESIFAINDINEDRIKSAFFSAHSYKEAHDILSNFLTAEELKQFNDCYKYFAPKIKKVISPKKEYVNILGKINKLNNEPDISNYLKKIQLFYNVPEKNNPIRAYIVWQPEKSDLRSYYINKTIVLSLKPSDIKQEISKGKYVELTSIFFHEMTHAYSSMSDEKIKQAFVSSLKKKLIIQDVSGHDLGQIIEEPLAVILGQKLFLKRFRQEYYHPYDNVYQNDWIKAMALIAEPLVEHYVCCTRAMDEEFIARYAELCLMLINAKKTI